MQKTKVIPSSDVIYGTLLYIVPMKREELDAITNAKIELTCIDLNNKKYTVELPVQKSRRPMSFPKSGITTYKE